MSQLHDGQRQPLEVPVHHEAWLAQFEGGSLAVLLAPRDHGKTTVVASYLCWRMWRHNRHPDTGRLLSDLPAGMWEAVIFSATRAQAAHFFEVVQGLLLANRHLFGDVLPDIRSTRGAAIPDVWSRTRTRLRNRAEFSIRAFQTSTRGLHPNLLILDDVLSDQNSGTAYGRDQVWRYFVGTLLPMHADKVIVIGTAFHQDDLLHRLRPLKGETE